MSAKAKSTRRVRVRLDFVIEFDRDLTSLPIGGPEDGKILAKALAVAAGKFPGAEAITRPTSWKFALDHRPTFPSSVPVSK